MGNSYLNNIELSLPDEFFKEEYRSGYLVTTNTKKIWAVMLDLIWQVMKVCEKHDIKWFIDGGSLLGTIRHGGFIPWDDDVDIAMPREEYEKFIKYASEELPEPYFVSDFKSECEKNHALAPATHATLKNSTTTCKKFAHICQNIKKYNTGIAIDIFPFDTVPDDNVVYAKWLNKIMARKKDDITYPENNEAMENVFIEYNGCGGKRLTNVTVSAKPRKFTFPKTDYSSYVLMPFETLQVRVPIGWKYHLDVNYPGWEKYYVLNGSMHRNYFTSADIPYKEDIGLHEKFKECGYVDAFFWYWREKKVIAAIPQKLWKLEE